MPLSLITGPIDAGKTLVLGRMAAMSGAAGVLSVKLYDGDGRLAGYDLLVLPARRVVPLARLDESRLPPGPRVRSGRFAFWSVAFAIADSLLRDSGAREVCIDEIGRLELAGRGFAPLLRHLLVGEVGVTATARTGAYRLWFGWLG